MQRDLAPLCELGQGQQAVTRLLAESAHYVIGTLCVISALFQLS
jgi:hypothetical protein